MSETALLSHLVGVPWLIHGPALQTLVELAQRQPPEPQNLEAWKALLAPHATPAAIAFRDSQPLPGARRAQLRDGVAIINLAGPVFRYANLFTEMSGATSLAHVASDLALAGDDSRVRSIVLNVDSPGGQATAIAEVAAQIRAVGERKPLVAYVDGMAGSAAYWLASAAPEVVLAQTAVVGALGAVMSIAPDRRDANAPIRIVSSQTPNKIPDAATEAGRAEYQGIVDRLAEEFLGAVASFRGLDMAAVIERSRGGGYLVGRDAVAAGFADRLGSFEEVLARLAAGDAGSAGGLSRLPSPARTSTGAIMAATEHKEAATAAETIPTPEAAAPPPPSAADAIAVERARCSAIVAAQKPGFGDLAKLAMDNGWTVETFAAAQDASATAVAEASKAAQLAGFTGSLPAPVDTAPAGAAAAPLTEADKRRATWDADAKLQAEFGEFAAYTAFLDAEARGAVRYVRRAA
jgi:ClpP class serine protease